MQIDRYPVHAGAHNSHLGDARATDMGRARGEVNIGQLMRERFAADNPENVINIGFTTHTGTVAAADDWDQPVKHKRVNPSMAGDTGMHAPPFSLAHPFLALADRRYRSMNVSS